MDIFIDKNCCKDKSNKIKNIILEFYPYAKNSLSYKDDPKTFLRFDDKNSKNFFGKTAFYNPDQREIHLYTNNRHPKDIVRSFAHELVHHDQNCRGEFDYYFSNQFNIGEDGYAQNNSHLRDMEREAYLTGNMIFRDWCDQHKLELKILLEENVNKNKQKKKQTDKEWYNSSLFNKLKEKWTKNKENKNGKP